jgi:uncharacterized membrane-anchored protein
MDEPIDGTSLAAMMTKVPAVALAFWIIKICATTAGETGGDALSMTLGLGYAISTLIFLGALIVLLAAQIRSRAYHPFLYWGVIIATTTTGTTISDYLDRTLGLGYPRSSLLLFAAVLIVLAAWRLTTGSVSVGGITTRTAELFYWAAILFSNTLGTALGDFLATTSRFGFDGGALVFGAALALIAAAYFFSNMSRAWMFWAAFVLTRPLGATLGDLLTKPRAEGGLDFSRIASSLIIAVAIVLLILLTDRGAEQGAAFVVGGADPA